MELLNGFTPPFLRKKYQGFPYWVILMAILSLFIMYEWQWFNDPDIGKPTFFMYLFAIILCNLLYFIIFNFISYLGFKWIVFLPLGFILNFFGIELSDETESKYSKIFGTVYTFIILIWARKEFYWDILNT